MDSGTIIVMASPPCEGVADEVIMGSDPPDHLEEASPTYTHKRKQTGQNEAPVMRGDLGGLTSEVPRTHVTVYNVQGGQVSSADLIRRFPERAGSINVLLIPVLIV